MPAERTRGAKKEEVHGVQLTWTAPVEPTAQPQIAFAPTVTPGTFADAVPPAEPDTEPALFPSEPDNVAPRRAPHARKKADDHIPRPPNAFILFRSSFIKSQHVSTEVETNHSTLSKIIGLTWQNMPHEERQFWHTKAKVAQAEHKRKWPDYSFRPHHVKGKGPEKRKVREVGIKDTKRCQKIAELLVEGKKGADLQAAIKEFDRYHVPPIITRFETPLTARMYRRSSSEPAPDTEPSVPKFLRSSSKSSSRRVRAVSTQPAPVPASSIPSPDVKSEGPSCSPETRPSEDDMYDSMPPLVLPPGPADYPFSEKQYPSFNFNTFVFAEASTPYYNSYIEDSCDPLTPVSPATTSGHAFPFNSADMQIPCTPQKDDVFAMSPVSSSPSFYSAWSSSPASFPSQPSTPQSFMSPMSSYGSSEDISTKQYGMPHDMLGQNEFNGGHMGSTAQYPMGLADTCNMPSLAALPPDPTSTFAPYGDLYPLSTPSKGNYLCNNHRPELAYLDVSFSDLLAQPLPNYTI
ncbi:hypothetical protein EVG20_g5262 [Dentipellis fragilis]|uniref:HMG box domain-containing protein n=1 Tax=Dentipellis fragilis TaxID=205917 RepID=A0A4Y9YVR3_9AGAM|nr:hypothetical protein EVG20_g5262 [Dentipellis fragilis]